MLFHQGKSYIWLFGAFSAIWLAGFAICQFALSNLLWGVLTIPTFILFILVSEIRSGIALDSWWRATHPKGTYVYTAMLVWHMLGLVLACVISFLFIGLL